MIRPRQQCGDALDIARSCGELSVGGASEEEVVAAVNRHVDGKVRSVLLGAASSGPESTSPLSGDFTLEVRQSGVPGAGNGLFVASGAVRGGDVITLYPGTVYGPKEQSFMYALVFTDNDYLVTRYDSVVIDGKMKEGSASATALKNFQTRDNAMRKPRCRNMESVALGNYINHSKTAKNATFWDVDIPIDDPNTSPYIPNVLFTASNRPVPSVAVVALQTIPTGSEIFVDYRFKPHSAPSWYS
ncbi:hypothetical protein Pelo_5672 [Pelomyxa schiedti]|nr:hypothetical protein Pelo_5672 [Pelomyxa schiedti]